MSDKQETNAMEVESVVKADLRDLAATDQYGNPLVQIDPQREKKLRLKIDLFVVPTVAFLYLFCFIDRANIGNARLAGFEADLNLSGNDYNEVLSIFYISYILFEIPATMLCKWIGPGWFLPAATLGFGVMSIATGFVHTKAQACGVRFLLGMFEAGLLPGIAYYLSRWYRRAELAFRIALYMIMAPLSGAFGGLLASGILRLNSFGSVHNWRMIFAIEGIVTVGISLVAFFTLTDRPETAKWLTEEEKDFAIVRVKSERIGTTHVLDKMDATKAKRGMLNPIVINTALIFLFNNITVQGISFFLPTIIKSIYPGRTTIDQQLLTVPPYIVGAFFVLLISFLSWHFDRRQIILGLGGPTVLIGYAMFLGSVDPQVRYGAIFLMCSTSFVLGPLCNANASANVVSDSARNMAIGTNVLFGNMGGLVATWTFFSWDAPRYAIGNGVNLACSAGIIILGFGGLLWMRFDNARRENRATAEIEEELAGLTDQQVEDLDWKHPGYRWKF